MAAGFFLTAAYFIHSMFAGRRAPANPWGGKSLEWQCSSPPPFDNFSKQPSVGDCYDFSDVEWDEKEQGYVIRPQPAGAAKKGSH
jgi:cytochrome c oxidase subunit 1